MGEIRLGSEGDNPNGAVVAGPKLVAQQVGDATIYFRVSGHPLAVDTSGELRPVAAIDTNVFDEAGKIVREGVKIVGERIREIGATLRPAELEVEISFGFEVKGKASIVPVLLTGESTANVGLKVTATWKNNDKA